VYSYLIQFDKMEESEAPPLPPMEQLPTCGGDMAGAIMFVAGALHNQEHAN